LSKPEVLTQHSTSTIQPLMWRRLDAGNLWQCWLPAALPVLVAQQHNFTFLPVLYTLCSCTMRCCMILYFFC